MIYLDGNILQINNKQKHNLLKSTKIKPKQKQLRKGLTMKTLIT